FRELARKLGIFLHVGSLAIKLLPEKAANRSFLIDSKGDIVARYDKIHMFDVELSGGERYRESPNYRPAETGVAADLPVGGPGLLGGGAGWTDGLLRSALPLALSRARRGRMFVSRHPLGVHQANRRSTLARA